MRKRRLALILSLASFSSPVIAQEEEVDAELVESESSEAEPESDDGILRESEPEIRSDPSGTEGLERLALVYDVPPECPSRQGFLGRLSEKSAPYRFAFHDTRGTLSLRIRVTDETFEGLSKLDSEASESVERRVEAPTCAEVLDSLAVMLGFQLAVPAPGGEPEEEGKCPLCEEPPKKKVALDRFNPQHGRSLTRRPRWAKKVAFVRQKETSDGPLRLQTHLAFDAHFGVTFGLLPSQPIPRLDVTARTALFLTAPGDRAFLMGFIPRVRFNHHFSQSEPLDRTDVALSGTGFGIGGCLSPYYDPNGIVVLGCADYGGGQYLIQADYPDEGAGYVYKTWANKLNLSLEVEAHVGTHFFFAVRGGVETNSYPGGASLTEQDEVLFEPGAITGFVTGGIGVQF